MSKISARYLATVCRLIGLVMSTFAVATTLSFVLASLFPALSQEKMMQRDARRIEAAKKEGKLVFWSSGGVKELEAVLAKFREKYPFLKTEVWRSGSAARHEKILAEARAGIYNFDVAATDLEFIRELRKAGVMKKYDWPNTKEWAPRHKDPEGYWVSRNILPVVIGYNTNLVSAAEAPKTWEDVLDPKWKGAISVDKDAGDWVLMLWDAWGKEKVVNYLKRLSQNNLVLGPGSTARTEMLAAGAFKIDVRLNLNRILEYQDKGAPLDWVRTNPIIAKGTPIFIAERAPHPNAAMLYADWYTSLEGGQAYNAASVRLTPHPGIKSRLSEALKGLNMSFTSADIAVHGNEANKIFEDIFLKK